MAFNTLIAMPESKDNESMEANPKSKEAEKIINFNLTILFFGAFNGRYFLNYEMAQRKLKF